MNLKANARCLLPAARARELRSGPTPIKAKRQYMCIDSLGKQVEATSSDLPSDLSGDL